MSNVNTVIENTKAEFEKNRILSLQYPKAYAVAMYLMSLLRISYPSLVPRIAEACEQDGIRLNWTKPKTTSVVVWQEGNILVMFLLACKHQEFDSPLTAASYIISMADVHEFTLKELEDKADKEVQRMTPTCASVGDSFWP